MLSAQLITIGTEITSGEVVNTNASWLSLRIEELGVRVYSHLSVRDQREEISTALSFAKHQLVIVTGGLGPTSDDMTRECLAVFAKKPLDFDNQVWNDLRALYEKRQLPLREAHRWQCHFPRGSTKLNNSVGTALGFYQAIDGRHFFVLPGPPSELEAMWKEEVLPRVKKLIEPSPMQWLRWTCLGAPESEVAEKVEPVVKDSGIEVGYRAQVPYVRVKIYADPVAQKSLITNIEQVLAPWIVARGNEDVAEELLRLWPDPEFTLVDSVTGATLLDRLYSTQRNLKINFRNLGELSGPGLQVSSVGDEFQVKCISSLGEANEKRTLPYKVSLSSERGKRSAAEWALWSALCAVRARVNQA